MPSIFKTMLIRIILLRFDIGSADFDYIQFVAADPPVKNLLCPCLGIELPLVIPTHQRNGQWPLFLADDQHFFIVAIAFQLMCGIVGGEEFSPAFLIDNRIAGAD